MADASTFRDSTQILLHPEALDAVREDLESEFTVTVLDGDPARIIGSPVEIKSVNEFLVRHGVYTA
jgi:hypothetical protein